MGELKVLINEEELQKRIVELNRNIEIGTLGRKLNRLC